MAQIDKNTVAADNQLKGNACTQFYGDGDGLRVTFVGNSITRHAPSPTIGWERDCGMAASCEENDYVHICMREISKKCKASFCVCQVAYFERNYMKEDYTPESFTPAAKFGSDIIVMRLVENVPRTDFDPAAFAEAYKGLIDFLDREGKAKVILTDGFWRHRDGDAVIRDVARERGYAMVELGDLGELDEMKAIGLFEHNGVANHPGDLGMKNIAERILKEIL